MLMEFEANSNFPYGTAGRTREAIVLAGGFGTRLRHVVPNVCKPMAPVASKPFLTYVLDQLDEAGFAHVTIADGYKSEQIETYFQGTYKGLELSYSTETNPLLTGGAVKKALGLCENKEVFILNGDTYFDANFEEMGKALASNQDARAVISIRHMFNFDRYGVLDLNPDGTVSKFNEKKAVAEGFINGGVYLLRHDTLVTEPEVFSLENDYFSEIVIKEPHSIATAVSAGEFIDIGVPEDYFRAQDMFLAKHKTCKLAIFDRDGTINIDTHHMHKIKDCIFIDDTLEIMRQYTEIPGWRIVVVTNQAGIAKGLYSIKDMRILHRQMAELLISKGIRVDGWYFCPHHPAITGDCECRKPSPGMLLRAMRDFGARPGDCIMYGDSDADMLAADAAGVNFCRII